jgi:alcohol dehydrogenase
VESYVTTRRNPISKMFASAAWRLLSASFTDALDRPEDVGARGNMMVGALLAGASIEASMLGAAHACANPITSRYELAHGAAVLLMLPHVVRFNQPVVGELYAELAREDDAAGRSGDLAGRLETVRRHGGLPERLRDIGILPEALSELADDAAAQWTAGFNPRSVSRDQLLALYETAW